MITLLGSCHCGQLQVTFTSERAPEDLPVRACTCTFCLRHAPRYTSDPGGHLSFRHDPALTSRYRFGLESADFLLCTRCGVYVGAFMPDAPRAFAVLNLLVLDARERFTQAVQTMDVDGEDLATRVARRRGRWTPATIA